MSFLKVFCYDFSTDLIKSITKRAHAVLACEAKTNETDHFHLETEEKNIFLAFLFLEKLKNLSKRT
jgi:hypothetical protein